MAYDESSGRELAKHEGGLWVVNQKHSPLLKFEGHLTVVLANSDSTKDCGEFEMVVFRDGVAYANDTTALAALTDDKEFWIEETSGLLWTHILIADVADDA